MPHPTCRTSSAVLLLGWMLLAASGCSLGSGGGVGFTQGQSLLRVTRRVRVAPPPTAPIPRELDKTVHTPYLVEPGDELLVEPASFESPLRFPVDQVVLSDGSIDLGAYGRVVVAGFTIEQIEALVQSVVREREQGKLADADLAVNVRLIDPQSKVYYVLGEVNAPGSFPLIGRETVLDAVLAAGGLTDTADPCKIVLTRPTSPTSCRVVLSICYNQIAQLGDTSTNYQIMPGDRIFVASRPWWSSFIPGAGRCSCPFCDDQQSACGNPRCSIPFTSYFIPPAETQTPSAMDGHEALPEPPSP